MLRRRVFQETWLKRLLDGAGPVILTTGKPAEDLEQEIKILLDGIRSAFVGSGPLLRGAHFKMLGIAVKR